MAWASGMAGATASSAEAEVDAPPLGHPDADEDAEEDPAGDAEAALPDRRTPTSQSPWKRFQSVITW